jgi:predicted membrane protein
LGVCLAAVSALLSLVSGRINSVVDALLAVWAVCVRLISRVFEAFVRLIAFFAPKPVQYNMTLPPEESFVPVASGLEITAKMPRWAIMLFIACLIALAIVVVILMLWALRNTKLSRVPRRKARRVTRSSRMLEALLARIRALREAGFSVAAETCGYADLTVLLAAVPYTSLFLWDVKDTDSARHRQYTGVPCERILENLRAVDAAGGRTRLRCILVRGVNTEAEHYRRIGELAASLQNCEGVEFLPYHAYGGTKSVFLGGKDSGKCEWIPTEEEVAEAKETVARFGIKTF